MPRKTYTDEFRAAAAKLAGEPGYTVEKAARNLGVDPGSIRRWVRQFAPASPPPAAGDSTEELRRENARLREENRRLAMEREILKKATAFFAREQP
jgi:transposase